ncbi:MAG: flavodoxin family protein [Prolixibacteraceae bacterium]|nr:flavodoxin family protein [Prolixibacteraceae bacterium]
MIITIVDGSPNGNNNTYPVELAELLKKTGHDVTLFEARNMNINYCTGCWSCWWKTPGICTHQDDMPQLYKSYLKSDLVIHYSPMLAGFISSKLKTINDRSIPLVHPYMAMVNNESHHQKRYSKYPKLGLILNRNGADNEDLDITRDLYSRLSINLKTNLSLFATTEKTQEEIIDEINRI